MTGLRTQGQTEEQILAPFEEGPDVFAVADPLQTKAFRQRWFGAALQADEMHSEWLEPLRQSLPDAAKTENSRGSTTEAASDRATPSPSLANVPFQFRKPAAQRNGGHYTPLGDGLRISRACRRDVGHSDVAFGGGSEVHAFKAGAPLLDQTQTDNSIHDLRVDSGHGRNQDRGLRSFPAESVRLDGFDRHSGQHATQVLAKSREACPGHNHPGLMRHDPIPGAPVHVREATSGGMSHERDTPHAGCCCIVADRRLASGGQDPFGHCKRSTGSRCRHSERIWNLTTA